MTVGRWSRSEMVLFEVGGLSMIIIIQPLLTITLLSGDPSHSLEVPSDAKDWSDHRCHPDFGGDSSEVQELLKNVQLQATKWAFAALLADGSVVAWGDPDSGGDSSTVQNQLQYLQQVDSCEVEDQLQNMQEAQATQQEACAPIAADGSVATWGDQDSASDSFKLEVWLRLGDCSSCTAEHGCAKKVARDGSSTYPHSMQLLCPVWGRGWTPEQGQWQVGFMVDMTSVIRLSDMVWLAPSQICCSRDHPSWIYRILIVG